MSQPAESANGSSSSSSVSDETIIQERATHACEIFHLQQQLAQTLQVFDHMRSLGVAPSMSPFLTDRVHVSKNGAPVLHNYDQSQLANSGMMNRTAYHSSVSAYNQVVTTPNSHSVPPSVPSFSSRQQVFHSQESNTI